LSCLKSLIQNDVLYEKYDQVETKQKRTTKSNRSYRQKSQQYSCW